jgi:hypothetical protein
MLSIEKAACNQESLKRFEANRPYKCIEIRPGQSHEILPNIDWNENSIVWLDYDGSLNLNVLADIRTVCAKAASGSVIIVTVNADPGQDIEENEEGQNKTRLQRLKALIGEDKIPFQMPEVIDGKRVLSKLTEKHFAAWGTAKILREIIHNEIASTLAQRNSALRENVKVLYKQLFNFHYSDNAKMLTVGGILYDQGLEHRVSSCAFDRFPFICCNEEPYRIEVPYLTYRELRKLDSELPTNDIDYLTTILPGVPEKDIQNYLKLYRYFPTFAEADL